MTLKKAVVKRPKTRPSAEKTKRKPKHEAQTKKTKFRDSKEWKDFRKELKDKQKVDPITRSPLNTKANCHHLDLREEHYTNLTDPSRYIMCNKRTHTMIHWGFNIWKKYGESFFDSLRRIFELMDKYSNDHLVGDP